MIEVKTIQIEKPGPENFDFLLGNWTVRNRLLDERLNNSDTWKEFEATLFVEERAFGQIDKFIATRDERYFEGFTLRLYNPETTQWSLYWTDNRTPVLQPPLVGSFQDGVGLFYAKDVFNGKDIVIRFIWKNITEISATWEQAFSKDDGQTWETNWIMDFKRTADSSSI